MIFLPYAALALCVLLPVSYAYLDASTGRPRKRRVGRHVASVVVLIAMGIVSLNGGGGSVILLLAGLAITYAGCHWLLYAPLYNRLHGQPASYVADVRVGKFAPTERLLIDAGMVAQDYVPFPGERRTRHVYMLKLSGWVAKLALLAFGLGILAWGFSLLTATL